MTYSCVHRLKALGEFSTPDLGSSYAVYIMLSTSYAQSIETTSARATLLSRRANIETSISNALVVCLARDNSRVYGLSSIGRYVPTISLNAAAAVQLLLDGPMTSTLPLGAVRTSDAPLY